MGEDSSTRDVEALLRAFEASDWAEAHIKTDALDLFLSRDPNARRPDDVPAAAAPSAPQGTDISAATPPPAASEPLAGAAAGAEDDLVDITAPNLGTFYRAPKPGAPPYVEIGQTVEADTEICLIEVMKLFTAVRAGRKGVIRDICVSDSDVVQYGQPLFRLEPRD